MKWSLPFLLLASCTCSMSFRGSPEPVQLDVASLRPLIDELAGEAGASVRDVRCPAPLRALPGGSVACEVELTTGANVAVVDVLDPRGHVLVRWKEPFLAGDMLAARAATILRGTGHAVPVACGDRVLRLTPGATVTCAVDGAPRDQVRITADGARALRVLHVHPQLSLTWPWVAPPRG